MKLYQLDQDKILEYKLMRYHKKEKEYKKELRSNMKKNGLAFSSFYELITADQALVQKLNAGENIDDGYYNAPTSNKTFSMSQYPTYDMKKEMILKGYINGLYQSSPCVKIENQRPNQYKQNYFLLTEQVEKENNNYTFKNVWKMPIECAAMTLLEQGKYDRFLEDEELLSSIPQNVYQLFQINEYDAKILTSEIPMMKQLNRTVEVQGKIIQKIKTK